ncbi:ABC transporter ATP-binding protein [Clostridium pasteurianum]|uniref:ATPase component of various ABC-type transport systems with duplicated ATPase domain n=1 Tax=Clostridium pasteurianum BC1 TaxID=86416 RepID=R4KD80_CLOPA|nr:energy-coupling factor transporter ATPase [Clostridium pasteurianum]AGK98494.1 ATPase component of various ABC-type transport systems with duplicated ATPase domain [Clostridium pasteurianum BC1]
MCYIKVQNLTYYYPREKKKTLDNIDFTINKGDFILIAGESGSGKSTLARCLSGAIPDFYGGTIGGEIYINKKHIKDIKHMDRAKEITMVFQDPERQLIMNMVHREIAFGLENVGIDKDKIKRRVFEAMQYSNLLEFAYRDITTLSGGEKQKVAITSALSYMPNCIILDEPTSQLDPSTAYEVYGLIKRINEELGITIIVIEQRIDKWFDAVDKIMVMKSGKKVFLGTKEEFYNERSTELEEFLPTYLKLARFLNFGRRPDSIKEMRKNIGNFQFNKPILKEAEARETIIKVKNVTCKYGEAQAVKDFSFSVNYKNFLAILGSNGAGKSTLMKAIMGLNKYSGSIKIFEREVSKTKLTELSKTVGYVSQNPSDYLTKDTVYEEVKFTLDNHNINNYAAIDQVLKTLEIYELKDKNPRDLSAGQRQRVALASILVLRPKILMLDEPTRGLDTKVKKMLGETLRLLNEAGTTILLITHDVDFVAEYCNKFLLMFNGEKVSIGNKSDVLSNGIFYTTTINKLIRNNEKNIFTLKEAMKMFQEERP